MEAEIQDPNRQECFNRNTVEAQEFLSDHVYRYIRSEDRIVIEV